MKSSLAIVRTAALGGYGDITDEAMNLLDRAVAAVKVDSTFGPPIYIPSPFRKEAQAAAESGASKTADTVVAGKGFDVARMLKPKITFEMRKGWGRNRSWAPYGDPGPSRWGFVAVSLIGLIILATYGGTTLVRRR